MGISAFVVFGGDNQETMDIAIQEKSSLSDTVFVGGLLPLT